MQGQGGNSPDTPLCLFFHDLLAYSPVGCGYNGLMRAEDELRAVIRQMQAGDFSVAAKLRTLLAAGELDAAGQAAAHVWLAEASDDAGFKLHCLRKALVCAPDNAQIQQGIQALLDDEPLAPSPPAAPRLPSFPRVVGIDGGANGKASAVFVTKSGMLATTSYALGGAQTLTISLDDGCRLTGKLLRRFPSLDLALVKAPLRLAGSLAIALPTLLAVGQGLVALGFDGTRTPATLTAQDGLGAGQWLATSLPTTKLPDAGGNPLYDEGGQLLGIMTRNSAGRELALALNISSILPLAEQAQRDRQMQPGACCCPACGGLARASIYGGGHCESCGAKLPTAKKPAAPHHDKLRQLYAETASPPCPHCAARVGFHRRSCLRCGRRSEA